MSLGAILRRLPVHSKNAVNFSSTLRNVLLGATSENQRRHYGGCHPSHGLASSVGVLAELNCVVRYYVLSAVRVAISALATRAVMILRFAETPNDL
jgi:hypothetical protein